MRPYRFESRQRERPLLQVVTMQRYFPQFQFRASGGGNVTWHGTLQPTESSPLYTIRILHQVWKHPRVWVVEPPLVESPPHVYASTGDALCLYYPPEWRWTPNEQLAQTIVPWTALWLYYYEAWIITGEWLGPSSHRQPHAKDAA